MTLVLSGIVLGISVAAPIGPVNVAVIRRGLATGFFPAWMIGLGAAVADTFYVFLIFLGLAPLLEQSVIFRLTLWFIGGAFLIYLGALGLRPRRMLATLAAASTPPGDIQPFFTGLGITLLNPMTIISWLVIGGAFFSTIALVERGVNGILFVLGIFIGSALWFSAIAAALHFARRFVNERTLRLVSSVASILLIVFGIGFILQAAQTMLGGAS